MISRENFLKLINKKTIFITIFILIFIYYINSSNNIIDSKFNTAEIKKSDLIISVTATGTLEPEEIVDVGAQVAGQIIKFGTDNEGKIIDYGSLVTQGSLLAQIDDSVYQAEVNSAQAQLTRANADLSQAKAKLKLAEQEWNRAKDLENSDALSKSSYQTYKANFDVATANVSVADAAIVQAQAALTKANRNLAFTTINSPVNGVIIDRRVNIGQTVVSSLNAPSLFLLAKDLKKMQVWIAVNEADIGKIFINQIVNFTVDTYPEEIFYGKVKKIRLNASMNQNIVTYIVEVDADNSKNKLLPYLTANAQFEVSNHKNVFVVPNAAIRWAPDTKLISKNYQEKYGNSDGKQTSKVIWIPDGEFLKPIPVKVVGSNGIISEIESSEIKEGQKIVIGLITENDQSKTTNPFTPQVFKKR